MHTDSRLPRAAMAAPCGSHVFQGLLGLLSLPVFLVLLGATGVAQAAEPADPPARVGRISFMAGDVEVRQTAADDAPAAAPATLNTPVTSGTTLVTTAQGRAEMRAGGLSLRLGGRTQLQVGRLDDQQLLVDLARGVAALRVRQWSVGERVVLAAQGVRLVAQGSGSYRLDADPQRQRVTARVFDGSAELIVGGNSTVLRAGQQARIDTLALAIAEQGDAERTPFEDWADQRDQKQDRVTARAARWVDPGVTGIEALEDSAGTWRSEPNYGAVWYPSAVVADWAPYRYGRWNWVAPWGWTWVDDAPWGFATMHYGRWLFLGGRWGWVPGQVVTTAVLPRPVFAPALVGFYGGGGAASGSVSMGIDVGSGPAVGWFPLGPGEVYRPGYAGSATYVRNLNATNVTNVMNVMKVNDVTGFTNSANHANGNATSGVNLNPASVPVATPHQPAASFRYAQTSFAATVVPRAAFVGGQPVAAAQQPVGPSALTAAGVAGTHAMPPAPNARAWAAQALPGQAPATAIAATAATAAAAPPSPRERAAQAALAPAQPSATPTVRAQQVQHAQQPAHTQQPLHTQRSPHDGDGHRRAVRSD